MEAKTKKGAASIYVVVVCALLFSVITAGFIVLMLNEMNKSSENNLSQSAYDSAIVGVEDAKILLTRYSDCISGGSDDEVCKEQLPTIENEIDCIDFAKIRPVNEDKSVIIKETKEGGATTVQEYTCVTIDTTPTDYLATLSGETPIRVIPLQATKDENKNIQNIQNIRISWYSSENLGNQTTNFSNNIAGNKVNFSDSASNPPVLVASIYQVGSSFKLDNFSETAGDKTNRGTLWLVPQGNDSASTMYDTKDNNTYYANWAESFSGNTRERTNILTAQALLDSNDHSKSNNAFPVRCATNSEATDLDYLCSVVLELPDPLNIDDSNNRNGDRGSFLLSLSLPYAQPQTDFKVEMSATSDGGFKSENSDYDAVAFDNVQIVIDSTGRANDVYSRVESRIEFFNADFPFPDYAMSALGGDNSGGIDKNFTTSSKDGDGCWYTTVEEGSGSGPTNCGAS